MRITAFANFADPQTLPMYQTLYEETGGNFVLAVTEPMEERLLSAGYPDYNHTLPFVERLYETADMKAQAVKLAAESDALIYGHCPVEYFNLSVKSGKPVFRLSQHIYRDGNLKAVPLKWKLSYFLKHTMALKGKPVYLMCLGTYTAQDFSLTHSYTGKMFEFGEFTETIDYDLNDLQKEKSRDPVCIVWRNNLHPWFHPDTVLDLAGKLKDRNVRFELYGTGELEAKLRERIKEEDLTAVTLSTDVSLETVRSALKRADVFLTTSSYNDGWGNMLNQAMNHACACVVSTAVGASKMIAMNQNGLLYEYGNQQDLYAKVVKLVDDPELCTRLGAAAFASSRDVWNGVEAGKRLYALINAVSAGKPSPFTEGLCSPAQIVTHEEMSRRAAQ